MAEIEYRRRQDHRTMPHVFVLGATKNAVGVVEEPGVVRESGGHPHFDGHIETLRICDILYVALPNPDPEPYSRAVQLFITLAKELDIAVVYDERGLDAAIAMGRFVL